MPVIKNENDIELEKDKKEDNIETAKNVDDKANERLERQEAELKLNIACDEEYERRVKGKENLEDKRQNSEEKLYQNIEKNVKEGNMPSKATYIYSKEHEHVISHVEKDDPLRYYDKGMLEIFLNQTMNHLFPGEGYPAIKDESNLIDNLDKEEDGVIVEEPNLTDEEKIKSVLADIYLYTQIDMSGVKYKYFALLEDKEERNIEAKLVNRIYRKLNALQEDFDARVEAHNHSKDKDDIQLPDDEQMYAISNFLNYFQRETCGKLGSIPEQYEDENALHINFTNKHMMNEENVKLVKKGIEDGVLNEQWPLEDDLRKRPLFPHTPTYEDVAQGTIGDCYFLAVLAEVAKKYPERIKEMIRDNMDGTATVRFYRETDRGAQPFYVTVDKYMTNGQTYGSVWAKTIEKAFAASGYTISYNHIHDEEDLTWEEKKPQPVPADIDEIYENYKEKNIKPDPDKYPWLVDKRGRLKKWEPKFDDISGGQPEIVMKLLLGDYCHTDYKNIFSIAGIYKDDIFEDDKEVWPIDIAEKYTKGEKKVFDQIEQAYNKGKLVCVSTYPSSNGDRKKVIGLNKRHAYSVIGTEHIFYDGKERLFIKVNNPHGAAKEDGIRQYVYNEKTKQLEAQHLKFDQYKDTEYHNGVNYIELKHFVREFKKMSIGKMTESVVEKQKRIASEEKKVLKSYEKAFTDVKKYLDKNTNFFGNSSEYNSLYRFVNKKLANHTSSNYISLHDKLDKLEKKLAKYEEHCKLNKIEGNLSRDSKLEACKMLKEIIANARNSWEDPEESLRKKAANKFLEDMLKSNPADDKQKNTLEYVNNNKDTVLKHIINSESFQTWVGHHKTYNKLFQTINNQPFDHTEIADKVFENYAQDRAPLTATMFK